MDQVSTTVEMDHSNFNDLRNQIVGNKESKSNNTQNSEVQEKKVPESKKYTFVKGDRSFDVDDDAEIEFMADKRPMKLTLRELKDRAAGDIAVKNRMHSLAEEKKRVQSTMKRFSDLSKTDPLAALEYISGQAKEADSEFEYNTYLEKLADQAEKLGQMDEKERKQFELEKKLSKAEQDLSLKERQEQLVNRKQEMLETYPEIGDSQFSQMVKAILENDHLLEDIEDENGVMDKVEELIQETLTQRDIMSIIREINPSYLSDKELIYALSDQIQQNPDLDEEDIRDIIGEILTPDQRRSLTSQKSKDALILSQKQRQGAPVSQQRINKGNDFDLLKMQLLDQKETFKRTPIYMR